MQIILLTYLLTYLEPFSRYRLSTYKARKLFVFPTLHIIIVCRPRSGGPCQNFYIKLIPQNWMDWATLCSGESCMILTSTVFRVLTGVGRYVGFAPMWERTICGIRVGELDISPVRGIGNTHTRLHSYG